MATYTSIQEGETRLQSTDDRPLPSEDYVPRAMPQVLGTFDMTAAFIMAVFWISNVTTIVTGGPAGLTYFVLCCVAFFVPCAIVIAQLGVMFPYEGSLYNWTYKALGTFWSFFIALCGWLPGVLSLVSAADVIVSVIQSLNPSWLVPAWQQGLVIIFITIVVGFLSIQRYRMVQNVINVAAMLTIVAVVFIGVAALAWLLKGKPSATNFADPTGWGISVAPQTNNLYLLGTVTLALLGANMPLNMAGELKDHKTILRHLLWGSLIVMGGYLIITFSILAVEGQNAAFTAPNSVALLLDAVDKGLGKFIGGLTAVCMMTFFIVVGVFENATSARLLMVAALDERLPFGVAQLNKQRIPANAIIFQTICACGFTAVIFFGTPLITFLGNTAALTTEAYTVTAAGLLLVWAFSFLFPFIDLAVLYFRHRTIFAPHRIFPMPVLIISCIVGPLVCLATIVDTLVYSWIPTLIGNNTWWYLVGGLTAVCLTLSAVGSILASGEASWQQVNV
ncbi:MAG TPA: APC family permease [Ktedonobacteraceae bacterium]|nr:APC family permease [Ktedonobacteraceae bacterium]